ncbi:RHS repeat domain-containing protein [Chitinophaga sp. Cy-1792]|uniref:RHS repeat domain-containing protein n=1 Tax=Chitinophaga sp. Cy-1792 TaxID=2608339 RepID=UPI00141EFDCC|nr:RHS repeat domain-containing protein [Chitinophaga sp. Cy-1792]NIG53183.1 RHS repeat protein [Chitinophaga sp. Cy-1792]
MKYLFALFLPVFITACNAQRGKFTTPRLQAITVHGEQKPALAFKYNDKGQLTAITRYINTSDTTTVRFDYDRFSRVTGMTYEQDNGNQTTVAQTATVTDWDLNGNIRQVDFFNKNHQKVQTAQVRWLNNQPLSLKYNQSRQATSWNYVEGNADWKNIKQAEDNDTTIYFTTSQYEWDFSRNPMRDLANQLLLTDSLPQCHPEAPLPDLCNLMLHISRNNPSLVRLKENQQTTAGKSISSFNRTTTVQYIYAYNSNGYPKSAQVFVNTEGYTHLKSQQQTMVDYQYE